MRGRGKWIGLGREFLGGGIVGSERFICGDSFFFLRQSSKMDGWSCFLFRWS
jgi:hypothetical protein